MDSTRKESPVEEVLRYGDKGALCRVAVEVYFNGDYADRIDVLRHMPLEQVGSEVLFKTNGCFEIARNKGYSFKSLESLEASQIADILIRIYDLERKSEDYGLYSEVLKENFPYETLQRKVRELDYLAPMAKIREVADFIEGMVRIKK